MKKIRSAIYTLLVLAVALVTAPVLADTTPVDEVNPVKVGVAASLTGKYKAQGESLLEGLSMWAADINARGSLLGRRVEIIHYNDESIPSKSAAIYEKLITQDKVDLLVGPYASDLTLPSAAVAEKYQFPMVSGTAASSAIWNQGYQNIFQVDVPAQFYMTYGVELAQRVGVKNVGIVYEDSLFTKEVAMGAKAQAEASGLEVTVYQAFPRDTTDFSGLIKQLKATQTEVVLGATYLDGSVALVREMKRQNYSPRAAAFTSGPSLQEFGEILGADAEYIIGFTPWIRATHEPMAFDFDFRYRLANGRGADSNAAGGYAAGEVLEAAVRLAGTIQDKDAIRKQLREMSFLSIMGRYKVDGTGKQVGKEMYLLQWQDGHRRLVRPRRVAETTSIRFVPWDQR